MCSISPMLIIQTFLKMPSQSLLADEEVGQREGDLISDLSASLFYLCLTAVKWALCPWRRIWQQWHSGWESSSLGQGKVIYFRWPARSSGLKLSLSFHSLFFTTPAPVPPLPVSLPFLFPCWVLTPFLQLQHTARMMGLRFCSVTRVETSSLTLTPLSRPFGGRGLKCWGWKSCYPPALRQLYESTSDEPRLQPNFEGLRHYKGHREMWPSSHLTGFLLLDSTAWRRLLKSISSREEGPVSGLLEIIFSSSSTWCQ